MSRVRSSSARSARASSRERPLESAATTRSAPALTAQIASAAAQASEGVGKLDSGTPHPRVGLSSRETA